MNKEGGILLEPVLCGHYIMQYWFDYEKLTFCFTMFNTCCRPSTLLMFKPGVSITQKVWWFIWSSLMSITCKLKEATVKGWRNFIWYFSSESCRIFLSVHCPWPVGQSQYLGNLVLLIKLVPLWYCHTKRSRFCWGMVTVTIRNGISLKLKLGSTQSDLLITLI